MAAAGFAATTAKNMLMPTGDARLNGESDGPSLPCGQFGPSEAGMVIIQAVEGAPLRR